MYRFYTVKAVSLAELEELVNDIISDKLVTDVKFTKVEKDSMGYVAYFVIDKVKTLQNISENKFQDTVNMQLIDDDE
jgi:hypothetical protein